MTLTLSPQLESRILEKLEKGEFANFEHLMVEALDRLDSDTYPEVTMEEFNAAMDEAHTQADNSETYSIEETRAYLAEQSAVRLRG